jgi:hypothetical protein
MRLPVLVVTAVVAAGASVLATPKILVVPLKWMLNVKGEHPESLPAFETTGGIRRLKIEQIVDKRNDKRQIGENTEKKVPGTVGVAGPSLGGVSVPISTMSDVPVFVQRNLLSLLQTAGLDIVADDAEAILKLELVRFWAVEANAYRADVRVRCQLVDVEGKEIWSAVVGGVGENWGRSLKWENYCETFSNAIFELAVRLLEQEGFNKGLRKKQP